MTEFELLDRLQSGEIQFKPLIVSNVRIGRIGKDSAPDAQIDIGIEGSEERFPLIIEAKAQNTPLAVKAAIAQARAYLRTGENPMILVPYLSPERLGELEKEQVSGLDACGNGLVIVPKQFYVLRSGQPNLIKNPRPLSNPYRGRSSLVARILLQRRDWASLSDVMTELSASGGKLSLSQASKAISALKDDLILSRKGNSISLQQPRILLDKLGREWQKPVFAKTQSLRLQTGITWPTLLSDPQLKCAVTGESSVERYTTFSQGTPQRIAVSNLAKAIALLNGKSEPVRNFADVELVETKEDGYYFANKTDADGVRWASQLQTWLELQAGDARQQDAAADIRKQILKKFDNSTYA